jgi:uncharacterized protein DUF1553/uncharacterized protein DUF1549/cytochrome c/F5/8 type C domain-containing protein
MPHVFDRHCLLALLSVLSWSDLRSSAADPKAIDFNRDIRPVLSNTCYHCHGPDEKERQVGLRLDTQDGMTAKLESGKVAIVPGRPEVSELVRRVTTTDADERMPPAGSGKKLEAREIELLTEWIKQGAPYAKHWSYLKPIRPAVPDSANLKSQISNLKFQIRNPIDAFILERLEREGLKPSPEADRYALARRVAIDLTGLPPSIEEVDAFVKDADPQAYEKFVDRLLKNESFGEHWAHMWLDLARFADSAGYADDPPRAIWGFRDYVIKSLNANKPFDQFTIEQIAGDLLPNPTDEQLVATAFHRNTLTNNEGGTNDEEFRNVAVVDRVNTTMAVWMGTTIHCAQCHTHKYDPISQEEYFRLFAFFNQSEDADRKDESPFIALESDSQRQQRAAWTSEIAQLDKKVSTSTPEIVAGQATWEQSFPLDLKWQALKPSSAASRGGAAVTITDDASIRVAPGQKTDTYTVELPLAAGPLTAVRLEALTDDSLAGKGPGHADGNFVLSKLSATLTPPNGARMNGRFVRVELLGKGVVLHLAEVQVFNGTDNVAVKGEAKQVSTDYGGTPERAIDGKTDGEYNNNSVSHTAAAENPWWEVDLKVEQPIERVVIWNRTDGGTEARLNNYRVLLLNEKRDVVSEFKSTEPPKPSREIALSGVREVRFSAALADHSQAGFEPRFVLEAQKDNGWAVGGQLGQTHTLTLISATPVEMQAGSKLTVTLEHNSIQEHHTLGRFRFGATNDARVTEFARTPPAILAILNTKPESRTDAHKADLAKYFLNIAPELQADRDKLANVKKQLADLKPAITVPVMKDLVAAMRRKTQIQRRGNFLDLDKEVTAGTPAAFHPLPADAPMNRLTLAKWLVDENNPLTARVIVNRYWEQLFGIGIVATSEDFGAQGELPYHPELLDWLAAEFVGMKWDVKQFLKLLVTSAAYRQSSRVTSELQDRDPDNRLLARGPRFRLSAETIRDQALAVSGLLSPKMYGEPVRPPQPVLGVSAAFGSGIDWQTSMGDDKYRRGLYTTWRRSNPYPSMSTFDAPNREVCTLRRSRTNTPLQALVTLNDPVYVEAAQALARKIAQSASTPAEKVRFGFRACLSRQPTDGELQRLVALYTKAFDEFAKKPDEAKKMATDPIGTVPEGADMKELAAWTVVGNVLLNLDEMLMKR